MLKLAKLMFLFCAIGSTAMADSGRWSTEEVWGTPFTLCDGETRSIDLGSWTQVKKVIIQAEGIYRDGTFQVLANGDVKGTVYVPGRDPSYIVTIAEATRSLEFRHVRGSRVKIRSVKVVRSADWNYKPSREYGSSSNLYSTDRTTDIALEMIDLSEKLEDYINAHMYIDYLLPIKKKAGAFYVMATARSSQSRKAYAASLALAAQVKWAYQNGFFDELLEVQNAYDLAIRFMSLAEELNEMYD